MSQPLLYDFNNDGNVSGADVVYFASSIAGIPGFNINNIDQPTSNKLIQYKYLNINNLVNFIVNETPTIVSDFSLNITPMLSNSKINVNINLNYLASCYPNTFLKLKLYYKINEQSILIGESILGTENTSFTHSNYSINIVTEPDYIINSTINYYIEAGIYTQPDNNGNTIDLSNLTDTEKPQLLFDHLGNSIILQEFL